MGKINESGFLTQCNHCGYSWYYNGNRAVTSCPNCGWRVRVTASQQGEVSNPPNITDNTGRKYW